MAWNKLPKQTHRLLQPACSPSSLPVHFGLKRHRHSVGWKGRYLGRALNQNETSHLYKCRAVRHLLLPLLHPQRRAPNLDPKYARHLVCPAVQVAPILELHCRLRRQRLHPVELKGTPSQNRLLWNLEHVKCTPFSRCKYSIEMNTVLRILVLCIFSFWAVRISKVICFSSAWS